MNRLATAYLYAWAVGAVLSAIGHLVLPVFMVNGTWWVLSKGWQNEIALFDIAISIFLILQIKVNNVKDLASHVLFITVLSVLLGSNHALSAYNGGLIYLHVAGVAANLFMVVSGLLILRKLASPFNKQTS